MLHVGFYFMAEIGFCQQNIKIDSKIQTNNRLNKGCYRISILFQELLLKFLST